MKNKISLYRKQKEITQEKMAKLLNVSRQTYINYENGDSECSFETLIKISQILETSIDELLGNKVSSISPKIIKDLEEVINKYKN